MAISRSSLTPLDGFEESIDWGAFNARIGARVMNILTGASLLVIHLAVFGVAMFGTMLWSLIQHPADLSSLEPFRVWGVIVALHVVLVGGWQLALRLFGWDEPDYVSTAAPVRRSQSDEYRQAVSAPVLPSGIEPSPEVNTTVRRWAIASSRKSPARPEAENTGQWPQQPSILTNDEREDVGEVTWPASAPRSTVLNASPAVANPSDELVSIDPAATGTAADGAQTWVDSFVESQTKPKEQRWSWVEAAAASWLSRRPNDRTTNEDDLTEELNVTSPEDHQLNDDGESSAEA